MIAFPLAEDGVYWLKFAVTVVSALMLTVVAADVEDATEPVQLTKCQPGAAVAVMVALAPVSYVPVPVTVPPSVGLANTVRLKVRRKVAVTVLFPLTLREAGLTLPVSAPDQDLKR